MSSERPESKVIRKNTVKITELIANGEHIHWFAAKLAEEAFITNARQFIVLGTDPFSQVSKMLGAVEAKLKTTDTQEETLKCFIKILQANPALVELASQLTAEYICYGGTAFQSSSSASASGSSSGTGGNSSTGANTLLDGEYERVSLKRDQIIRFLAANVNPEGLADRLLVRKLIGEDIRAQAFVSSLTNAEKIRRLMNAVIARIDLNPANYVKFIDVLKQDGSLGDLIQFIETAQ